MSVLSGCSQAAPGTMTLVTGGMFRNTKSAFFGSTISLEDFYIGVYEVTQKEWTEIMGSNPSRFKGDNLPVEMVTWYECVEYCNKLSVKEGLQPFYRIDKEHPDPNNMSPDDDLRWTVTVNAGADGYRLPFEAEWEYAAAGGQLSKSCTYSGSFNLDDVGWYWRNAGRNYLSGFWNWPAIDNNNNSTQPVGGKQPNELGLYDMAGNVREWCWEWYGDPGSGSIAGGSVRVWRGGGWIGAEQACETTFRGKYEPCNRGPDQGFRVCRSR